MPLFAKRFALLAATAFLYGAAIYKNVSFEKLHALEKRNAVTMSSTTGDSSINEPHFKELFINEEAPGRISHVSSIAYIGSGGNGKMGAVWYSGSREGARDVAIFFSVLDGGAWSEPSMLVDRKSSSRELKRYVKKVGNPMLFSGTDGKLWLFYASIFVGGWSDASINYKTSADGGKTWSDSRKLILSPFFNHTNNVKNGGLNLDDGSLLIPAYHELANKFSQIVRIYPAAKGVGYEIMKIAPGPQNLQPSIMYEGNGKLTALFRNAEKSDKKYILTSRSNDMGKTWSPLENTTLPNPNSGLDAVVLENGDYLAVINNSFENRENLTVVVSEDKGATWKTIKVLEEGPGMRYSYPSIARAPDGVYHLTYTFERKRIKHAAFNEAWVEKMKHDGG